MFSEAYLSTNKYCPLFDRPQRGAARHLLHRALILDLHSYYSTTYEMEDIRGGKPNREIRRGSRMAVRFIVVKTSCVTRGYDIQQGFFGKWTPPASPRTYPGVRAVKRPVTSDQKTGSIPVQPKAWLYFHL